MWSRSRDFHPSEARSNLRKLVLAEAAEAFHAEAAVSLTQASQNLGKSGHHVVHQRVDNGRIRSHGDLADWCCPFGRNCRPLGRLGSEAARSINPPRTTTGSNLRPVFRQAIGMPTVPFRLPPNPSAPLSDFWSLATSGWIRSENLRPASLSEAPVLESKRPRRSRAFLWTREATLAFVPLFGLIVKRPFSQTPSPV